MSLFRGQTLKLQAFYFVSPVLPSESFSLCVWGQITESLPSNPLPPPLSDRYVVEQLQCLGILQTCEVLKVGMPTRVTYAELKEVRTPATLVSFIPLCSASPYIVQRYFFFCSSPLAHDLLYNTAVVLRCGGLAFIRDRNESLRRFCHPPPRVWNDQTPPPFVLGTPFFVLFSHVVFAQVLGDKAAEADKLFKGEPETALIASILWAFEVF